MRDADGAVRCVYRLAAGPRRTERIDANIFGVDPDLHLVSFRQYGNSNRRSVDTTLRFRHRHSLYAMNARFVLQLAVHLLAVDDGDDFLQTADSRLTGVGDIHFPAVSLSKTRVHAEDLVRKQS